MGFRRFKYFAFLFLFLGSTAGWGIYGPDGISKGEKERWAAMSGKDAGKALLEFRSRDRPEEFANHFILFLDQGRSTQEILACLGVLGLPLLEEEVEALAEVYMETPLEMRHHNALENGYQLACHVTPGTRLELVFLDAEERRVYAKWMRLKGKIETPREEEVAAELEGRLCVWAKDRKIHLGGPKFTYERVKPILTIPSKK